MRKASEKVRHEDASIDLTLTLDGQGQTNIDSSIGFIDHMLGQFARYGRFDLELKATGDTHVDDHHLVEQLGRALGRAIRSAVGEDRYGLDRYGHSYVPLDETLMRVVLDLSDRPYLVWNVTFLREKVGNFDTELCREFFYWLAMGAHMTLHVECLYGANAHHMAEAMFKALGLALKQAANQLDKK